MSIFDAVAERIVLVELYPYDPVSTLTVTLRVADRDTATGPADTPAHAAFDGFLKSLTFSRSLIAPSRLRGGSVGLTGAIRVGNPSRDDGQAGNKLDAWRGYRWQGRRYAVWLWEAGTAWSTRVQVMAGSVAGFAEDSGDIVLALGDRQKDFRRDIQASLYAGTGGFEGPAALGGKPKPVGWGLNRQVNPIPVDPPNLWFDLNAGAISDVLAVSDQGVALSPSVSNPPPSGSFYEDLANGRMRLGAAPAGEIRVDFRGDASGSGYVSTHADILRRIATTKGGLADPGDLDTASFSALNTANAAETGIWIGSERRSLADVLDRLMAGCGGFWIFTGLDKLRVGRIEAPAATETTADLVVTDYDIVRRSLKRIAVETPPYLIVGRYKRYLAPLDRSQMAGAVTEANKADLVQEWRQVTKLTAVAQTEWPASAPLTVDLGVDASADAQTETDRVAGLYSTERRMFSATIGLQGLQRELHDQIWLKHPDEGLAAGDDLRLTGLEVDLVRGTTTPEMWG